MESFPPFIRRTKVIVPNESIKFTCPSRHDATGLLSAKAAGGVSPHPIGWRPAGVQPLHPRSLRDSAPGAGTVGLFCNCALFAAHAPERRAISVTRHRSLRHMYGQKNVTHGQRTESVLTECNGRPAAHRGVETSCHDYGTSIRSTLPCPRFVPVPISRRTHTFRRSPESRRPLSGKARPMAGFCKKLKFMLIVAASPTVPVN